MINTYIKKIFNFKIDKSYISIPQKFASPIEKLDGINSFSILPRSYETKLDDKYRIRLGEIKNGKKTKFSGDLENNVSFNGNGTYKINRIEEKILKKYKSIPGFCSMKIDNKKELMEHVKIIHELSYNHYVFGKESNMKKEFPFWCCGNSSRNLLLTLMEKGYPNASYFYNGYRDHAYNGLPFTFGKNQKKGFIIIDPTSDQLFNNKDHAPRNNLFVIFGNKWEYKTDWKFGSDLFPHPNEDSSFSNLNTLRKHSDSSLYRSKNIEKYFKNVFNNSVNVNINTI